MIAQSRTMLAMLLLFGAGATVDAQIVERAPRLPQTPAGGVAGVAGGPVTPAPDILSQLAFNYSPDAVRSSIQLARYWVNPMGNVFIPIYFFSDPSVLLPAGKDSVKYTARELLSQIGGLLNVAVAKNYLFPGSVPGLLGPQGDLRIGGKYVQMPSADSKRGTVVGQLAGSFSWYMRVFADQNAGQGKDLRSRPDTVSQKGVITLNVRGTADFLGGAAYRNLFKDASGNVPPAALGSVQLDGSIHLFDQLYLTGGYTFSISSLVKGSGFGGFSLSPR